MNAALYPAPRPAIGDPIEGGYFAGVVNIKGQKFGLAFAPKALGEIASATWNDRDDDVPGAQSFVDGLANTRAMAEAGSVVAKQALEAEISGHTDWYIPAQDELEISYRAFKPTSDENSRWNRSGVNASAVPPTLPYSEEPAVQTQLTAFQAGGDEAFEEARYLSSTQHPDNSGYASSQYFGYGGQNYWTKDGKLRVRLVRRFPI